METIVWGYASYSSYAVKNNRSSNAINQKHNMKPDGKIIKTLNTVQHPTY